MNGLPRRVDFAPPPEQNEDDENDDYVESDDAKSESDDDSRGRGEQRVEVLFWGGEEGKRDCALCWRKRRQSVEKRAEECVDVGFAFRENNDVVVREQEWENRESYQPPGVKIEIRDDDVVERVRGERRVRRRGGGRRDATTTSEKDAITDKASATV